MGIANYWSVYVLVIIAKVMPVPGKLEIWLTDTWLFILLLLKLSVTVRASVLVKQMLWLWLFKCLIGSCRFLLILLVTSWIMMHLMVHPVVLGILNGTTVTSNHYEGFKIIVEGRRRRVEVFIVNSLLDGFPCKAEWGGGNSCQLGSVIACGLWYSDLSLWLLRARR